MKYGLLITLLLLSACGSGGTYSEAPTANNIRCAELLQQCRFNENEQGCLAIKQTPEQGRIDDVFFAQFCSL